MRAMVIGKQRGERTELRCNNRHIHSLTPQLLNVPIIVSGRHSYSSYYCNFKCSRFYSRYCYNLRRYSHEQDRHMPFLNGIYILL